MFTETGGGVGEGQGKALRLEMRWRLERVNPMRPHNGVG